MSIVINGEELSIAQKQKINGVDITEIKLNGETLWQLDDQPHTVPDMSVCLTRTGGSTSHSTNKSGNRVWVRPTEYGYNYVGTSGWVQGDGTPGSLTIYSSYSGVIDKTKLPNGHLIKHLIVYRRNGGAVTYDVSNSDTLNVSDSGSSSNSTGAYGEVSVSSYSGINRIDYKYV